MTCPSWCDVPRRHSIHSRTLMAGRGLSVGLVSGPAGETKIGLTAGGASVAVTRAEALAVAAALRKALRLADQRPAADRAHAEAGGRS